MTFFKANNGNEDRSNKKVKFQKKETGLALCKINIKYSVKLRYLYYIIY